MAVEDPGASEVMTGSTSSRVALDPFVPEGGRPTLAHGDLHRHRSRHLEMKADTDILPRGFPSSRSVTFHDSGQNEHASTICPVVPISFNPAKCQNAARACLLG